MILLHRSTMPSSQNWRCSNVAVAGSWGRPCWLGQLSLNGNPLVGADHLSVSSRSSARSTARAIARSAELLLVTYWKYCMMHMLHPTRPNLSQRVQQAHHHSVSVYSCLSCMIWDLLNRDWTLHYDHLKCLSIVLLWQGQLQEYRWTISVASEVIFGKLDMGGCNCSYSNLKSHSAIWLLTKWLITCYEEGDLTK
jgi:hypothetical protein